MLACAMPSIDKAQIVQFLRHPIDWDLVLQQAAWHCVSPLVYRSLQAEANSGVPPKVLSALQASFEENFHKNLFLSGQMIRLANGFRERNIPVIGYKGPVLCTYYGHLGSTPATNRFRRWQSDVARPAAQIDARKKSRRRPHACTGPHWWHWPTGREDSQRTPRRDHSRRRFGFAGGNEKRFQQTCRWLGMGKNFRTFSAITPVVARCRRHYHVQRK